MKKIEDWEVHFWTKMDKGDGPLKCWPWLMARDKDGYGIFTYRYEGEYIQGRAHRYAYKVTYGPIPMGMLVCHRCDNSSCCNPVHLWLGTNKENIQDSLRKGRFPIGDRNGSRLHPEKLARGDDNGSRKYPEKRPRGDNNWARRYPEKVRRGDRHPLRINPELVQRGEDNGNAKITKNIVLTIRTEYKFKIVTAKMLAQKFNVSESLIMAVLKRRAWAHVQ